MRLLLYFLGSPAKGRCDAWRSTASKTGVNLTLASSSSFCVYWYESVLWSVFLPNLREWDYFHSIAVETEGQTRPEPEWCPLSPRRLAFTVQCNKLHSWHQCLHASPPTLQHRSSLPELQSDTISTSTKDSPLRFFPRAPGVKQRLQTCTKAMAGRIGKLWLLFNKLKNYIYVTVIWEREALLVMAWTTDRKKSEANMTWSGK